MDEGPRTQCKGICKGAAHAFRIIILVFSLPVVCSKGGQKQTISHT